MNEKTEDPRSKTSPKRGLKKGAVVIIEKSIDSEINSVPIFPPISESV